MHFKNSILSGDQCAILKNTKELRDKLKELGYKKILPSLNDDEYTAICTIPLRGIRASSKVFILRDVCRFLLIILLL